MRANRGVIHYLPTVRPVETKEFLVIITDIIGHDDVVVTAVFIALQKAAVASAEVVVNVDVLLVLVIVQLYRTTIGSPPGTDAPNVNEPVVGYLHIISCADNAHWSPMGAERFSRIVEVVGGNESVIAVVAQSHGYVRELATTDNVVMGPFIQENSA